MREFDKAMRNMEGPGGEVEKRSGRLPQAPREEGAVRRIVVNKRTHRVWLENETESEVTVVIEEKGRGK